jgi:hypothetical protein
MLLLINFEMIILNNFHSSPITVVESPSSDRNVECDVNVGLRATIIGEQIPDRFDAKKYKREIN